MVRPEAATDSSVDQPPQPPNDEKTHQEEEVVDVRKGILGESDEEAKSRDASKGTNASLPDAQKEDKSTGNNYSVSLEELNISPNRNEKEPGYTTEEDHQQQEVIDVKKGASSESEKEATAADVREETITLLPDAQKKDTFTRRNDNISLQELNIAQNLNGKKAGCTPKGNHQEEEVVDVKKGASRDCDKKAKLGYVREEANTALLDAQQENESNRRNNIISPDELEIAKSHYKKGTGLNSEVYIQPLLSKAGKVKSSLEAELDSALHLEMLDQEKRDDYVSALFKLLVIGVELDCLNEKLYKCEHAIDQVDCDETCVPSHKSVIKDILSDIYKTLSDGIKKIAFCIYMEERTPARHSGILIYINDIPVGTLDFRANSKWKAAISFVFRVRSNLKFYKPPNPSTIKQSLAFLVTDSLSSDIAYRKSSR